MTNKSIRIGVVDDHNLFRKGLIKLVHSLSDSFEVVLEASNGQDFFDKKPEEFNLDILIVDLDMPVMNGFELAEELISRSSQLPVLALTMHGEDESAIIRMIRSGVKGYLSKDVEPEELKTAIESIAAHNFHFNQALSGQLMRMIVSDSNMPKQLFKENELIFLRLCCSELTYKEIADRMFLSPKTIDGYRATLFERFKTKSRVGLALLAVKNRWVDLNEIP